MSPIGLFWLLVTGNAVSSFGSFLNMVALNLFVFQSTGSALSTGLFMALRLGCGFLAGILGGTIAARLPRKVTMITCDLVQAAVLLALVIVPQSVRISLLPVVAVSTGLLSSTSSVLLRSSVPNIVGQDDRERANGMLVTGRALAMVAGFTAGGLLVSGLGFTAAFTVDAATFLVSAATLALLPLRLSGDDKAPEQGYVSRQRTALAALLAVPSVLVIVLIRAVDAFGSASHNVGTPVYATLMRPDDPGTFLAYFMAIWAFGVVLAHQVVRRLRGLTEKYRAERGFVIGTCLMSAAFIAAFAAFPFPVVLAFSFIAGLADGFTEITYTSRIQAEPEPARGYFFGFTAMAENAGFGSGMILAAGLLQIWTPLGVAALMHGVAILIAAGYLIVTTRGRPAHDPSPGTGAGQPFRRTRRGDRARRGLRSAGPDGESGTS